jgi:hypothetical protein
MSWKLPTCGHGIALLSYRGIYDLRASQFQVSQITLRFTVVAKMANTPIHGCAFSPLFLKIIRLPLPLNLR